MQIDPLQRPLKPADLPLERLAANANLTEQDKVTEVSRQFEALLLRQILQEAQQPVFQSSLTSNSTATGIYRDLVTEQLANSISKSGSFGLAKTLDSQLNRQLRPRPANAEGRPSPAASPATTSRGPTAAPAPPRRPVHLNVRPHD